MSSAFPTSLDMFSDPTSTTRTDTGIPHGALHALVNDAIAALEAKVGINSSAVTSSHDYKIAAIVASLASLAGTSLLYGTGAPGSGLGVDGNFYLNTSTYVLYGPKASGAWPSGTSLIGPTGSPGSPGSPGSAGAAGATGATGATGAPGSAGAAGATGATGATGAPGSAGAAGATGATGAAGATGATGAPGSAGAAGATGATGADGKTVRNGSGAPSGGLGVDGDFYINTAAETIYGPKTSGAWGSATSLVGPTGATGATGATGGSGGGGPSVTFFA
jgi:hypothetical protein